MFRTALLGLFLIAAASAATVTSFNIQVSANTDNVFTVFSNSKPSVGGTIDQDGWVGTLNAVSNLDLSNNFSFPLTLSLTDTDITCNNDLGCGFLQLAFSGSFTIDGFIPEMVEPAPFLVSIIGSGPDAGIFYDIEVSDGYFANNEGFLPGGAYNFLDSGFLGVGNSSGTFFVGNTTIYLSGNLSIGSANFSDELILADSFQTHVGTSDVPEPGTLSMILGTAGAGLAASLWRRRRSVQS